MHVKAIEFAANAAVCVRSRTHRKVKSVAARADIVWIRIQKIERAFNPSDAKKVVVVYEHGIGSADTLHHISHLHEKAAVIDVVRIAEILDVQFGKIPAAIFEPASYRFV